MMRIHVIFITYLHFGKPLRQREEDPFNEA